MGKALQLYLDLKEMKLFGAYRYYYHDSWADKDLNVAVEMKKNYVRMAKGRAIRIGHNWEAVAEWFVDKFTTGAKFWVQNNRNGGMDPRRIRLHLLKGVGGRRTSAEVDRVWEVTPGIFAPQIIYVLSCKWSVVSKKHADDFFDVLRWSAPFLKSCRNFEEMKQKRGIVDLHGCLSHCP